MTLEQFSAIDNEHYYDVNGLGARFMLFEGPKFTPYLRTGLKESEEGHGMIVDRFRKEVKAEISAQLGEFFVCGGGYYLFQKPNNLYHASLIGRELIFFHHESSEFGRFEERLLASLLLGRSLPEGRGWIIGNIHQKYNHRMRILLSGVENEEEKEWELP
jgi:hypothetical protein